MKGMLSLIEELGSQVLHLGGREWAVRGLAVDAGHVRGKLEGLGGLAGIGIVVADVLHEAGASTNGPIDTVLVDASLATAAKGLTMLAVMVP
jgi:hypothetical protein